MSDTNLDKALATLRQRIGASTPATDWFEITQQCVDRFADVVMDHQWIHVDVARATTGPFGAPIAHGDLTLSLMRHLPRSEVAAWPALAGLKMTINYGFDRIRFPAPVRVGTRIRALSTLKRAEIRNGMIETMREFRVEIQGEDRPAVVAEHLSRLVF